MRIGAHVSASGGIDKAIDRAVEIGAECVQIFPSAPQTWTFRAPPEESVLSFLEKTKEFDVGPNFLHGIYLVNLGSPQPENLNKSRAALVNYLNVASMIGAQGVIFHSGSHKGVGFKSVLSQTVERMTEVLDASPSDTQLIIENCAGMGNQIGASFSEIGQIMKGLASPRVKVCLDTQHSFAAGYDVRSREGLERTLEEFDAEVGLEHLVAVHANDSKIPFAGGVDRHENIGFGSIGIEGFQCIMEHPALAEIPFLLEVPGIERKGPDRENVDVLKRIRDKQS
ncbi:MAG: deoxyribonuclease IV [SAR202 cluster bacterium]|mgnify:FL=1|nr:deoxyribonuclease IV [SAR202 cluster bacterium]